MNLWDKMSSGHYVDYKKKSFEFESEKLTRKIPSGPRIYREK